MKVHLETMRMKKTFVPTVIGIVSILTGCYSPPLALGPVGPNPIEPAHPGSNGNLEVYSSEIRRQDNQNQGGDGMPVWYRHSDYRIYDQGGRLMARVHNSTGHYSDSPTMVILAPGKYVVKAEARNYFLVKVPVTIAAGLVTSVHLDDNWKPPPDAPPHSFVIAPNGYAVGWRAQSK